MPTDILRKRSDGAARAARATAPAAERIVVITAGRIVLRARLAATATADRIWTALPLYGVVEPWGDAIHFEVPVSSGRDRTARLQTSPGDICFWSDERRVLIAYGPTPISRPGEVRMPAPVNVFASALDDVGVLRDVRVGEKVHLARSADGDPVA